MTNDERIAAAIKRLPIKQRKVFVAALVERKPLAEIAAQLHISDDQVAECFTKALKRCRGRLRKIEIPGA